MGLNPIYFAVICFIVLYSMGYARKEKHPVWFAIFGTFASWFFISCIHYFITITPK